LGLSLFTCGSIADFVAAIRAAKEGNENPLTAAKNDKKSDDDNPDSEQSDTDKKSDSKKSKKKKKEKKENNQKSDSDDSDHDEKSKSKKNDKKPDSKKDDKKNDNNADSKKHNENADQEPDVEDGGGSFTASYAIPDTLDARTAVHEPRGHDHTNTKESGDDQHGELIDGPFLALLTGNKNLNAAAQMGAAQPQLIPDTVNARFAVHQVLQQAHVPELTTNERVPDTIDNRFCVTEVVDHSPKYMLKLRGVNSKPLLDSERIQFWKDSGYLVVPDALSRETVSELLQCVHNTAEAIATGGPSVRQREFSKFEDSCVNPNGRVIAALTESTYIRRLERRTLTSCLQRPSSRVLHPSSTYNAWAVVFIAFYQPFAKRS